MCYKCDCSRSENVLDEGTVTSQPMPYKYRLLKATNVDDNDINTIQK